MSEAFLHYIWKHRLLDNRVYTTSSGESVELIHPGIHNSDSGPDFFNAKLRLGEITWAGNVEIHINASDWIQHGHASDKAYNNVILHVVYNDDSKNHRVLNQIETLEIKDRFSPSLYMHYKRFDSRASWIPCALNLNNTEIDKRLISSYIDRLYKEKIKTRMIRFSQAYNRNGASMEKTFYNCLVASFGFGKNKLPFELLAKSMPLELIDNHKEDLKSLEALVFGQAGFLCRPLKSGYGKELRERYRQLNDNYRLKPMEMHLWKFLRLRPSNFPTIRLAQLSVLMHERKDLFNSVLSSYKLNELKDLFRVFPSDYWITHYHFEKTSTRIEKRIGESAINNILINAVLPFMIFYGNKTGDIQVYNRANVFYNQLEGEANAITKKWKALKMPIKSAIDSQGFLWLKTHYCDKKKCLSCDIGQQILNSSRDD